MEKKLSHKIAICIADHSGEIISQNEACTSLCSIPKGSTCPFLFSHSHLTQDHRENIQDTEGMIFRKCHIMGEIPVDVVTINDGTTLTTMFYPLNEHIQKQLAILKSYNLSKRELEVAYLMLNGRTNEMITKSLFISKATLKTHINCIYKKIPKNKLYLLKER